MERKEFLEITLMSVKINMLRAEDEVERAISIVHSAILEAFVINEHLDILNVEESIQDEAIKYIIEQTNDEIVRDLLEINKRLYEEDLEEEEEYLICR